MSTETDIATQIQIRAALDIDDVWGYPSRMTIIDPSLDGYREMVYEGLRAGQNIVLHMDGIEVLMRPRRSVVARLRRKVNVDVRWRPLALDGEATRPEPTAGLQFEASVSRGSLFEPPVAHA